MMTSTPKQQEAYTVPRWRMALVALAFMALLLGIVARLVDLHLVQKDFLGQQGKQRMVRSEVLPATRGVITDRNGQPLAISTPVKNIWINPKHFDARNIKSVAKVLDLSLGRLAKKMASNTRRSFVYIKRNVSPEIAAELQALKLKGVYQESAYRRFYPAAEVTSHLIGMVNIDGKGQEGIELSYDQYLQGQEGERLVVKDLVGNAIKQLGVKSAAQAGQDLQLTLDLRLQYLAYRELKAAVQQHHAKWGSAVLLDAKSGEILALVNRPSYNPNNRSTLKPQQMRNRALTDIFEPGSTMKPFTVLSAIETGRVSANTIINTSPGYMRVKHKTIRDHRDYGAMTVSKIITKSSNVGVTKLAHDIGAKTLWSTLYKSGFGQATALGFPGEAVGRLPAAKQLDKLSLATLSFGYGLSVTPLQLAQSYTVFANHGCRHNAHLLMANDVEPCQQVVKPKLADQVVKMLQTVTEKGGTGTRARVKGFTVGGKTGTAHKVGSQGYQESAYSAVFAGLAPASDPRFVLVVVIDQPQGKEYYGGEVAAPVFSRIMAGALRVMQQVPDQANELQILKMAGVSPVMQQRMQQNMQQQALEQDQTNEFQMAGGW